MKKLMVLNNDEHIQLFDWVSNLTYGRKVKSSYAPDRLEQWFGLASNMQSVAHGRAEIIKNPPPPNFITSIGDMYLPGWDSVLVCKGVKPESDTSIDWHRDHSHFEGPAVMINFGISIYLENDYKEGILKGNLTDGDVVWIDTKLAHKSTQVSLVRYNITFRTVKPEFKKQKITLF